jgi:hypothetical protein
MNQRETSDLLYHAAASRAIGLGFRLGDGADGNFRHYAEVAAREIVHGQAGEIDENLTRAVRNFQLLVDTMISERMRAYENQPQMLMGNVIGELTLTAALNRLCPLWPFCE